MKTSFRQTQPLEQGYILVMTSVFLFLLVAGSAHFYYRTTENTSMTGISRDSSKSLMLAESAMELLRGQFVRSRLDTDATTRVGSCLQSGTTSDTCESGDLVANMNNPETRLFEYMFYISATNALENSTPQLLQIVANGESSLQVTNPLTSRKIAASTTGLRINDLFNTGSGLQPRLYTLTINSRLTDSVEDSWDAETSSEKAAAWIEVIVNPGNPDSVDLIVQAVGQVGKAKSYLQMFAGSFSAGGVVGVIPALSESSELQRGNAPT